MAYNPDEVERHRTEVCGLFEQPYTPPNPTSYWSRVWGSEISLVNEERREHLLPVSSQNTLVSSEIQDLAETTVFVRKK